MEQWEVNAYLSDIELNIKNGNTETALDGLNTLSVKLGGGEQIPCANAGLCSVAGPEVRAGLQDGDVGRFAMLNPEERDALRVLIQNHLNTISEISLHKEFRVLGYLAWLEKLENELIRGNLAGAYRSGLCAA